MIFTSVLWSTCLTQSQMVLLWNQVPSDENLLKTTWQLCPSWQLCHSGYAGVQDSEESLFSVMLPIHVCKRLMTLALLSHSQDIDVTGNVHAIWRRILRFGKSLALHCLIGLLLENLASPLVGSLSIVASSAVAPGIPVLVMANRLCMSQQHLGCCR